MTSYQLLFHFTKKKKDGESHDARLIRAQEIHIFVSVYEQKDAFFTLSCSSDIPLFGHGEDIYVKTFQDKLQSLYFKVAC